MYENFLSTDKLSKQKLCKRNYRFIHSFQINHDKRCPKIISKLKLISSLDLYTRGDDPTSLHLLEKLFKFHHRYLKNVGKGLENPRFQRLLPLLDQLNLSQDPAHWRLSTSRSAFRTLTFNFEYIGLQHQNPPELTIKHFNKFQAALRRNLPKMRALSSLKIMALIENPELIVSMLEVINEKVHVESLKHFSLSINVGKSWDHPHIVLTKPMKIERALQSLTKLSVDDSERYTFLLFHTTFKNLSDLYLNYSPEEGSDDFGQISRFKDLPKLKKFSLSFDSRSPACEAQFFEDFVVPSRVEHLELALIGFEWNEMPENDEKTVQQERFESDPLMIEFFERIQNCCQNVKVLSLSIHYAEKIHPALNGRLARLFVQRFTDLERICFQAAQFEDPSSNPNNQPKQPKQPLDLSEFWKGLESFKDTLVLIFISAERMTFRETPDVLETRFPRLENFNLQGEVLCPVEIGTFCCSIPSLKRIILHDLLFSDEKDLRRCLLSWRHIPQGMKIDLRLNVKEIQQQPFIDCLMEFIQEAGIKGDLKMCFLDVYVFNTKAFQGILNEARKKGCFEELYLVSNVGLAMLKIQRNVVCYKVEALTVS